MELVWQERSLAGRILSLTHGQAPAPPPEPAATAPERVHPKLHIYTNHGAEIFNKSLKFVNLMIVKICIFFKLF